MGERVPVEVGQRRVSPDGGHWKVHCIYGDKYHRRVCFAEAGRPETMTNDKWKLDEVERWPVVDGKGEGE